MPWILMLGLVHSLIYVAILPPWQHYDEPSHLEYVLLIVRRGRLPRPGDSDLEMRREISSSMVEAGFYRGQEGPTIDFWSEVPPAIGVDELVHPPLYYLLVAAAVWPLSHQGVELQLYVARLCSTGLYLVVLLAACKIVAEALPRRPWLPAAVTVFLALLPPFTDRMSSVNSDVGATAAASLMLWAAVALARRGMSIRRAAIFAVTVGLCLATKATAGIVALTTALVVAGLSVPARWRRLLLAGTCVLAAAFLVVMLTRQGHAANWYSADPGGAANRIKVETPLDGSGFVLAGRGSSGPKGIYQELAVDPGRALRGKAVTLGGWVRADGGTAGNVLFSLDEGTRSQAWAANATSSWQFFTFTGMVGTDARGVAVHVAIPNRTGAAGRVYLDGLFLVEGSPEPSEEMMIADSPASRVRSGSRDLPNLLRNGSAERRWPSLPNILGRRILGRSPAAEIVFSAWDWKRTAWVLWPEATVLFKSFWGGFGWNHLELPAAAFYVLVAVTGAALGGAALAIVRRLRTIRSDPLRSGRTWVLLSIALITTWGMVLLRIYPVFVTARIWWPVARYADVAIVPAALLVCGGLAELVPHRLHRAAALGGLLGLLALDAIALGMVIVPYYCG